MPSQDWLKKNPKVSAHIPQELYSKLQEFMKKHDIQSNAEALKTILSEYFNNKVDQSEQESSSLINHSVDQRLTTLESQINRISQQVIDLEKPSEEHHSSSPVNHSKIKSSSQVVNSSSLPAIEEWLTSSEAFSEAKRRGYCKTKSSMKRDLKSGSVLPNLEKLGLVANWEARKQADPKDNSVRWLRFED